MKKAFLLILDGWGLGSVPEADAIFQANTPYFDHLWASCPHSTLVTHGEAVGLPDGQMGNSEVGHINIGAGRIVWQDLARLNKAVREKELGQNPVLLEALSLAVKQGKTVHLMGLVSDGGVHSHIDHLKALCDITAQFGCPRVLIHAFTDGRDCDPQSGAGFVKELSNHIQNKPIQLASVIGRYYAMDRDKRWERVKLAYDLLVNGTGEAISDFESAIQTSYSKGITDEFLLPMKNAAIDDVAIKPGDIVICFNFRTDRCREITQVLTQFDLHEYNMHAMPLHYVTMTRYDDAFQGVQVMYDKDDVKMTLGEVIEKANRTQLRIAETEKYPHVTFFFSGGREEPFVGERRIMVPSPKVATYDLQPEMSAEGITKAVIEDMRENAPDFICLNFANTDMVGHTGVFSAGIKAAETVDACLARIVPTALEKGYSCLIIADHGNSDYMINEDGSPNTAHTKNPVPCILVNAIFDPNIHLRAGCLADVAPTLLQLMDIEKGPEMSGKSLIEA